MARIQRNKQLRPLHLFICEDSKSSKYYMQGLGRAKGINIKAEEADGTSPENVLRSAKEKLNSFTDKEFVQIYCLFDKDDCEDEKFKKVVQQCRKAGFVDAVSIPCYEYGFYCILKELTSHLEMPENAVKHSNPNIIRSFKPSIQLSN